MLPYVINTPLVVKIIAIIINGISNRGMDVSNNIRGSKSNNNNASDFLLRVMS
jgi:hypothetical protein